MSPTSPVNVDLVSTLNARLRSPIDEPMGSNVMYLVHDGSIVTDDGAGTFSLRHYLR